MVRGEKRFVVLQIALDADRIAKISAIADPERIAGLKINILGE
ncbi:MAG: hypothetical protein ACREHF_00820 [Rhizomicrobium sp.]